MGEKSDLEDEVGCSGCVVLISFVALWAVGIISLGAFDTFGKPEVARVVVYASLPAVMLIWSAIDYRSASKRLRKIKERKTE